MSIYDYKGDIQIGFHGCDVSTRDKLLLNPYDVQKSVEKYDWLGSGFYIWENNYRRAEEWAQEKKLREEEKGKSFDPSVIGVVYILGNCLDLADSKYTEMLPAAFESLKRNLEAAGMSLPVNGDVKGDENHDMLLRNRDCAVINHLCESIITEKEEKFDTVRGIFPEGDFAYEGARIRLKTHTQISIRNLDCIKGFFLPKFKPPYLD